jgi:hypothetical protein
MPDPITLQKIKETADLLHCRGIATLDDLRMCIAQDVETGVYWVSLNTGASQGLLMALLIAEATDDAAKRGSRKLSSYWPSLKASSPILSLPMRLWHNWKKYWPDALAAALVLLASTGVVMRARAIGKGDVQYVAARQGISLPVFHQLGDNDLEMTSTPSSKGSFTSIEQVRGRYTLSAIPSGELLLATQLLSADLSAKMKGRQILSVALKPTAYSATLAPPSEAVMILSPRALDAKIAEPMPFNVIVLNIDTIGELKSATVALSQDKFAIAGPLLASHEVFLSQVIP